MIVHCAMLAAARCLHDDTVLFQGFEHATGVSPLGTRLNDYSLTPNCKHSAWCWMFGKCRFFLMQRLGKANSGSQVQFLSHKCSRKLLEVRHVQLLSCKRSRSLVEAAFVVLQWIWKGIGKLSRSAFCAPQRLGKCCCRFGMCRFHLAKIGRCSSSAVFIQQRPRKTAW